MINEYSKIYKLIKEYNIEWFTTINNIDNINSKNFFRILHVIDYNNNVVIISDIESIHNNFYRITIHDELLDAHIININKENKSIERYINNTIYNKKNFIQIINNKFNMNDDRIDILPVTTLSSQNQNITSILSPKNNINKPEINQKSTSNNIFSTKKVLLPINFIKN
jgi:hypothetical protein